MKVLLSAFACDPLRGSEPGNGWNWSAGVAELGYEVHCITRGVSRSHIESVTYHSSLNFHYVSLPLGLEKLYSLSQPTMYLYYILWQWFAYKRALRLHKKLSFQLTHHVTWGSLQMGSFMYRLSIPFVFGPTGGGQLAPVAFRKYFLHGWDAEMKRSRVANAMFRYNPAFKAMIKKAKAVIVSNPDTYQLAVKGGAQNVFATLDAALPAVFFPKEFFPKTTEHGNLKLLWVGRMMPRKGLLLLLEVMLELKAYKNIMLTVVGDGEMMKAVQNYVASHALSNSVFIEGAVPFEQVKKYYDSHDAFAFTSLRDSCPAQLIEAMAYGLPVVTINLHGQSVIVNDATGIKCSCETPEIARMELVEAILQLANNPDLVFSMSKAAHEFAKKQTWESKIRMITEKFYPA